MPSYLVSDDVVAADNSNQFNQFASGLGDPTAPPPAQDQTDTSAPPVRDDWMDPMASLPSPDAYVPGDPVATALNGHPTPDQYQPGQSTVTPTSPLPTDFFAGTPSPSAPVEAPLQAPSSSYEDLARAAAAKYHIDPDVFVRQLQQESGLQPFNPDGSVKVSKAGARGIAQFMPETAAGMGINPDDPAQAIDAAARLDAQNLQRYGGDYSKMLAAYNAGPGNVDSGAWTSFPETQAYVSNILSGQPSGTRPVSDRTADIGAPVNRPSQFAEGLSYADALAACGPTAALALANKYGDGNIPIEAVMQAAKDNNLWDPANGMHGVQAEQQLLADEGVKTRLETEVDWNHVQSDVTNGNPVVLSTPGHYFVIDGYDPQTGAYHVGTSGTDLKRGADWMTADQMQSLEGGASGALYVDNPNASGPSVAETSPQPQSSGGNQSPNPIQNFGDWASSLGNPLDALGKAKDNALSTIGQATSAAGQAAENALGSVAAVHGAANAAEPEASYTSAPLPAGQQPEPTGVQLIQRAEQKKDQAIEQANPIRDVPVLGGLTTGIANMATDPLTYALGPGIGHVLEGAGSDLVEQAVTKTLGPEAASKIPAAIKWAADQGLIGAGWGALQGAENPDATPQSIAENAAVGVPFGIGAGLLGAGARKALGPAVDRVRSYFPGGAMPTSAAEAAARELTPEEQVQAQAIYRQIVKAVHPDINPDADPALIRQANDAYSSGTNAGLDTLTKMAKDLGVTPNAQQVASADANVSWFSQVKQAASDFIAGHTPDFSGLSDLGKQVGAWVYRNPEADMADRGGALVLASDLSKAADAQSESGVGQALVGLARLGNGVASDPIDKFSPIPPAPSPYTELGGAPKGAQFLSGGGDNTPRFQSIEGGKTQRDRLQSQIDALTQQRESLTPRLMELTPSASGNSAPLSPTQQAEYSGLRTQEDSLTKQIDALKQQLNASYAAAGETPNPYAGQGWREAKWQEGYEAGLDASAPTPDAARGTVFQEGFAAARSQGSEKKPVTPQVTEPPAGTKYVLPSFVTSQYAGRGTTSVPQQLPPVQEASPHTAPAAEHGSAAPAEPTKSVEPQNETGPNGVSKAQFVADQTPLLTERALARTKRTVESEIAGAKYNIERGTARNMPKVLKDARVALAAAEADAAYTDKNQLPPRVQDQVQREVEQRWQNYVAGRKLDAIQIHRVSIALTPHGRSGESVEWTQGREEYVPGKRSDQEHSASQPAGTTLVPGENAHGHGSEPVRREPGAEPERASHGGPPGAGEHPERPSQSEGSGAAGTSSPRYPAAGSEPRTERPAPTRGVGSSTPRGPEQPGVEPGQNYRPTPEDLRWWEKTPASQRFAANVDAISRAQDIVNTGRPVTDADRAAFARYSGMGDTRFNDAFPLSKSKNPDPRLVQLGEQLRQLLGDKEYASLSQSRLNAHYSTPPVIKAMWDALQRMGAGSLPSLRVLEPSAGNGRFLGMMPQDLADRAALTAVELDIVTARMLTALYPNAQVFNMGFERVDADRPGSVPNDSQDIVISNVPFGNYGVADPEYLDRPVLTSAIHNYFFAKALDKARPGGIVAFITSRFTMDSSGMDVRRYLAARTQLLGAIRLPQDAFPDTAVTTDIIFLQKREHPVIESDADAGWVRTQPFTGEFKGEPIESRINDYFIAHPEMALGEHGFSGHTTTGVPDYVLKKTGDVEKLLEQAIKKLPAEVIHPYTAADGPTPETLAAGKVGAGSFVERDGKLMTAVPIEGTKDLEFKPAGRWVERDVSKLTGQDKLSAIIQAGEGGSLKKARVWAPYTPHEVQRIRDMLRIHDLGREVLDAQQQGHDVRSIKRDQAELKRAYDTFVKANGPLHLQSNRSLLIRSGGLTDTRAYWLLALERWDDDLAKAFKGGRRAPTPAELQQLRSDLFTSTDLAAPPKPVDRVATPKDALAVALNEMGSLDFQRMVEVLGRPAQEIADDLHRERLIYRNPERKGRWELADEYLSGNVRDKLKAAEDAARKNPTKYAANVEALKAVVPADVPHGEIDVRLGTHWIPVDDVNQFVRETLFESRYQDDRYQPIQRVAGGDTAMWRLNSANAGYMLDPVKSAEYGTQRRNALSLLEPAMNNQEVRIYFPAVEGEKRVLDEKATLAAQGAIRKLRAAFKEWLWSDPQRAERLSRFYNDTYNSWRNREFDGSHLTLPGSSPAIEMRPHQLGVVWRSITEPTVLIAHEVGYGKSMSMAAAAMEKKRMGLERKPAFVVPNHLVGQMAREFWKLYPSANLLVPDKRDFEPAGRATLMSRIATGDWDGVIIPQSQFKLLPVHPQTALDFMEQLAADLQAVITAYQAAHHGRVDKDDRTFKDLQKRLAKMRAQLQEQRDRLKQYQQSHAHSLFWDDMGVDALYVDEADQYKNLPFFTTMSRIKGLPNADSDRAFDMHMKTQILLQKYGRGVTFATGTPISNTIAELWTMLRYLMPETLKDLEMSAFDAWASAYGESTQDTEQTITGEWKPVTRFAKFGNIPELQALFQRVADIRMAEDSPEMEAKKPGLRGGHRIKVVVKPLPWHKAYVEYLLWRAEHLPPDGKGDNMLVITGDAKKASLDPSMVRTPKLNPDGSLWREPFADGTPNPHGAPKLLATRGPEHPQGKINLLVDNVVRIWDRETPDRGTQLVFLDLGTPKENDTAGAKLPNELKQAIADARLKARAEGEDFDEDSERELIRNWYLEHNADPEEAALADAVYQRIKQKLIARGIPEHEIAFIHDAPPGPKQLALFDKVNNGDIRVLIGSTEKMGAGTNVQQRAAALHHLDTPWRPRDLEQREGRVNRPGNKVYGPPTDDKGNPLLDANGKPRKGRGVEVYQYTTEWPFDSVLWSTLLAKIRAIKSVVRRKPAERWVLDADPHTLDLEDLRAAASGDPLAQKRRAVAHELLGLEASERDFLNAQAGYAERIRELPGHIEQNKAQIAQAQKDLAIVQAAGDGFTVTIDGKKYDKRPEAGQALVDAFNRIYDENQSRYEYTETPIGSFKGLQLVAFQKGQYVGLALRNPQIGSASKNIQEWARYSTGTLGPESLSAQGLVQRLENLPGNIRDALKYAEGRLKSNTQDLADAQQLSKRTFSDALRIQQLRDAMELIEKRMLGDKEITDAQIDAALEGGVAKDPTRELEPNPAEEIQIAQMEDQQPESAESDTLPETPEAFQQSEAAAPRPAELGTSTEVEPAVEGGAGSGGVRPPTETPATQSLEQPLVSEAPSDENAPPRPPRAQRTGTPRTRPNGGSFDTQAESAAQPEGVQTLDLGTGPEAEAAEAPTNVAAAEAPSSRVPYTNPEIDAAIKAGAERINQQVEDIPPAVKYDYQSTQANLPADLAAKIERYQLGIKPEDLAPQGLETQPHITLKYGLHPGVSVDDVRRILADQPPIRVTFGNTASFPAGEDGAPLYISVDSPDLHRLNGMLSAVLPHEDTFPEYTPHITVAYLRPDAVDKYVGEATPITGQTTELNSIAFSDPNGHQVEIPLEGRARRNGRSNGKSNGAITPREPSENISGGSGGRGNGASGKPPTPPAPPTPPEPPTPEEPERQHIVGFGYQSGLSPEAEDVMRTAAEAFKTGPVSQAEVARAAQVMALDEPSMQRFRELLLSDEKALSVASQALRYRARAAVEAVQRFDRLHAEDAAKQANNVDLSPADKEALFDATRDVLLNAAQLALKESRRAASEFGRGLNQMKYVVTAEGAQKAYQRLDAAASIIDDASKVLESLTDGHEPTPIEAAAISVAAEQLDKLADAADEADRQEAKIAASPAMSTAQQLEQEVGFSRSTAEALADRPLLDQKSLDLVRLTPEWKAARAAGEWDRVNQIEKQRAALIHEMDSLLAAEEAERQAARSGKPKQRSEQIDIEASAAKGVIAKMRRELRERLRNPDAARDAELARINDQIRQLVLEQEVSGKDLLPKSARLVEMNKQQADARDRGDYARVARIEQERAKVLQEIRDQVEAQVREKIARGPRKFTTGAELEQAVREAMGKGIVREITRAINEQLHPQREIGRTTEQIRRRFQAELEREKLRELAKKLRDLGSSPFRQGTTIRTIQAIHETIQQLQTVSAAGQEKARDIRYALRKSGIFRYAERNDIPPGQLDNLITLVMTADPDKPEQIGQVMRWLRHPTTWDKLREYTVINMLSSMLTWGGTGVSVLSHLLIGSGRILVAMPLDALHDQVRHGGKNISIGEVPAALRGIKATIPESLRLYRDIMRQGFTSDAVQSAIEMGDLGALRREYLSETGASLRWTHVPGLNKVTVPPWVFQWMHRLSTRPVEAAYASMGHTLYGGMVHALAYREARRLLATGEWEKAMRGAAGFTTEGGYAPVPKPTQDELVQYILRNAPDFPHIAKQAGAIEDYSLLRSKLPRWATSFSYLRHAPPGSSGMRQALAFAIHQMFPFIVVPTNFTTMGLDNSALGVVYNSARYSREKDPFKQAEFFHKALVGALIALAGFALLEGDNLTGQGPSDPAKRRMWLTTHQVDSVRIPGTQMWWSYDGTLFAIPLGMIANAAESAQEQMVKTGKKPNGTDLLNITAAFLGGMVKGTIEGVASQSFVRTFGDLEGMLSGNKSTANFWSSQVDKFIPTGAMLALFARMGDEVQRQSKDFTEQVAERIPGLREQQPAALNPLGQPEPNDQQGLAGLLPFRPASRPDQNNPVIQEFNRLGVDLPAAPPTVKTVPLTAQEQHDYEADVGPRIQDAVSKVMASPAYQRLSDAQKAKVLQTIVRKEHTAEEALTIKRIGTNEFRNRLLAVKKAA
jgi:N12 class adenine-specific DNA methylase/2'-5' RNA ligase